MKTLFFFAALLGLLACKGPENQNAQDSLSTQNTCDTSSNQKNPSDLDYDIGEILLVGFRGTEVDKKNHIRRDIKDYHVGSVILFDYDAPTGSRGRNIKNSKQIKALCKQLRELSPTLLIGIDQEGGRVSRLSTKYGFPYIMSAQRSAELGYDTVRYYARKTAEMLSGLGINLNFAPVADINVNPDCPVIGKLERSFSTKPSVVTQCCTLWIDEQHAQGVACCLKHFPGHGSATGDTHKGLVDVSDTWQRGELTPYRKLCKMDNLDMVMTAHVINRQLDPSGLPASLSPKITSYLRDTLGFQGVIITDDLAMGAIVNEYTLEQTVRMALDAGADLLCLSNNGGYGYDPEIVPKVVKIIKKLVDDGTVSPERIHQSAERVRALKRRFSTTTQ